MKGSKEYDQIIHNIRAIIKEKGFKQKVVAERAGFSEQDLSHILNDRRQLLRVEHIPRLAAALGVEIKELFP